MSVAYTFQYYLESIFYEALSAQFCPCEITTSATRMFFQRNSKTNAHIPSGLGYFFFERSKAFFRTRSSRLEAIALRNKEKRKV